MRWDRYLGGTSAYVVSSAGARKLLEIVLRQGLPYNLERLFAVHGPGLRGLECDPPLVTGAAPAPARRPAVERSRRPDRGSISIYLGASWVPWHPVDIVTRGLGGSETASYRLADALSQLGYAVTLYGDFDQSMIGAVQLRPWETFDPDEPRRGLISSRNPELFDTELAADSLLWVHDADFEDRLTPERSAGVDAVVCLSAWHRGHLAQRYPWIADKLVTVRNGITPRYFTRPPAPERARRVLFSSSPDRGLDVLLELWPLVRERVPDAELVHLYAPVYDSVADQDPAIGAHRETIRSLSAQPGVRRLGGLSQPALAQLMRASLVWAHPSYCTPYAGRFHETSCIGAMEAQAAGCCVVAADWGALPETVQTGMLIDGDPAGADFKERFAAAIVAGLTDPDLQRTAQTKGPPRALRWDWGGVAEVVAREIETLAAR
jgi:glycosyltransferase involved in cell wall biosynthesis